MNLLWVINGRKKRDRGKGKRNYAFHPQHKQKFPEFVKLIHYHYGVLLNSESTRISLSLLVQGLPLNESEGHQWQCL